MASPGGGLPPTPLSARSLPHASKPRQSLVANAALGRNGSKDGKQTWVHVSILQLLLFLLSSYIASKARRFTYTKAKLPTAPLRTHAPYITPTEKHRGEFRALRERGACNGMKKKKRTEKEKKKKKKTRNEV